MSDFRSLLVWQKSMLVARHAYSFTARLPKEEKFGLSSQIQRCAVSIPSNISEGSKRGTKQDFRHFLRVASGSAAELETQLLLAHDLYSVSITGVLAPLKETQKMLESFIKKL
ncbi:MAG: four helix bundle protein [Patescibacteria group bacterium]|nr:four helix bundle protein [Patescibacteria group bacterium]